MIAINKSLFFRESAGVGIAILVLWVARFYHEWYGAIPLIEAGVRWAFSLLTFPAALLFWLGAPDHGLLVFPFVILASAVVWGVLVERIAWAIRKPNDVRQ